MRAALVAAFKGIQRSPRARQNLGRTRVAPHTHTIRKAPPYPVQRQAIGGSYAGFERMFLAVQLADPADPPLRKFPRSIGLAEKQA